MHIPSNCTVLSLGVCSPAIRMAPAAKCTASGLHSARYLSAGSHELHGAGLQTKSWTRPVRARSVWPRELRGVWSLKPGAQSPGASSSTAGTLSGSRPLRCGPCQDTGPAQDADSARGTQSPAHAHHLGPVADEHIATAWVTPASQGVPAAPPPAAGQGVPAAPPPGRSSMPPLSPTERAVARGIALPNRARLCLRPAISTHEAKWSYTMKL